MNKFECMLKISNLLALVLGPCCCGCTACCRASVVFGEYDWWEGQKRMATDVLWAVCKMCSSFFAFQGFLSVSLFVFPTISFSFLQSSLFSTWLFENYWGGLSLDDTFTLPTKKKRNLNICQGKSWDWGLCVLMENSLLSYCFIFLYFLFICNYITCHPGLLVTKIFSGRKSNETLLKASLLFDALQSVCAGDNSHLKCLPANAVSKLTANSWDCSAHFASVQY